jgi:hypothetical protein
MKMSRRLLALCFCLLLVAVGSADEPIQPKTIEANARAGKKVSLTFLLPEKSDRDEFMKSNRLMAGMWAQRGVFGKQVELKENDTHWIGDVHYPIYNYHGVRLYMVGGIKIRKTPAIHALPAKKKEVLLKILRTRGDLILKETGNVREYDVVAFHDGVEKVFSVFTLNNQWMFKDFGKASLVTIQLDSFGGIRIGGQKVAFDEVANKVHGLFPTKVIVRAPKDFPQAKINELRKAISNSYFFDVVVTNDGD